MTQTHASQNALSIIYPFTRIELNSNDGFVLCTLRLGFDTVQNTLVHVLPGVLPFLQTLRHKNNTHSRDSAVHERGKWGSSNHGFEWI